jgi:hypothetical protein
MKRSLNWRPKWSIVSVALAAILAIAVVSPAVGGPSLKSLVKKEVKKQISKATGPAGAPGAPGAPGANGAAGSALGFATIQGNGDVDEANSSANITDANVTTAGNIFCFNGLPFTPKVTVANVDLNFAVGNTVQTTTANANGACPGAEQASALQANSTGAVVAPVRFHLAFY